MATPALSQTSVELFYSYSHADEELCLKLQKHLASLKRSGLINNWYDRKIDPGAVWADEIQRAMERAGIILFLVSADFLDSDYIFENELPFALRQHDSGRAIVIPILLRPVQWQDSPFAKLQVLPSRAVPVTSWTNQDEAFSDVAGKLREILYSRRINSLNPSAQESTAKSTKRRMLDSAIASSTTVGEPTEVVTMIRTTLSGGLHSILLTDRTYSPASSDVRKSSTFEVDFPVDRFGKALPVSLTLALESPSFDPSYQRKSLLVPHRGDSGVMVFMLTPIREGRLTLTLRVLAANAAGETEIGSCFLATETSYPTGTERDHLFRVVSIPLGVVSIVGPGEYDHLTTEGEGLKKYPTFAPPSVFRSENVATPIMPARKRSSRMLTSVITSSLVAVGVLFTALIWQRGLHSPRTSISEDSGSWRSESRPDPQPRLPQPTPSESQPASQQPQPPQPTPSDPQPVPQPRPTQPTPSESQPASQQPQPPQPTPSDPQPVPQPRPPQPTPSDPQPVPQPRPTQPTPSDHQPVPQARIQEPVPSDSQPIPSPRTSPDQTSPNAGVRTFTVYNRSTATIRRLFVSPSSSTRWGSDRLGTNLLNPNWKVTVELEPGYYDVKLVDQDGDSCVLNNVDFSHSDFLVLNNTNLLACEFLGR